MSDPQELDQRLQTTLAAAKEPRRKSQISLGPLQVLSALFADEFEVLSFPTLGALSVALFPSFYSMLEFQSKLKVSAFLSKGYSLLITAGNLHEIVAAVI